MISPYWLTIILKWLKLLEATQNENIFHDYDTIPNNIVQCAKFLFLWLKDFLNQSFKIIWGYFLDSELISSIQITNLWPAIVFSNFPSYAPHIFTSLSAATKIKESRISKASTRSYQERLHLTALILEKPEKNKALFFEEIRKFMER